MDEKPIVEYIKNEEKIGKVEVVNFPGPKFMGCEVSKWNVALTVSLIIVTVASIVIAVLSIRATNSIRNVEVYLAKERMREHINYNIILAENLIMDQSHGDSTKSTLNFWFGDLNKITRTIFPILPASLSPFQKRLQHGLW